MAKHGNRTPEQIIHDITVHGCHCPLSKQEAIPLASHLLEHRLKDNRVAKAMIDFFNDRAPGMALKLPFERYDHPEAGMLLLPNKEIIKGIIGG